MFLGCQGVKTPMDKWIDTLFYGIKDDKMVIRGCQEKNWQMKGACDLFAVCVNTPHPMDGPFAHEASSVGGLEFSREFGREMGFQGWDGRSALMNSLENSTTCSDVLGCGL